jgi:hypothetical protein
MGLNVITLFTRFGFGSLVFGELLLLRLDFGAALGAFAAVEAAAVVAPDSPVSARASARHGQAQRAAPIAGCRFRTPRRR